MIAISGFSRRHGWLGHPFPVALDTPACQILSQPPGLSGIYPFMASVLLGGTVGSCQFAVSDTGGGRIIDHAQNHQQSKHGVHHGQQLVANLAQVQRKAEQGGYRLHQQKQRGNRGQPEVLVLDTYNPVNHFVFLLKNQPSPSRARINPTTAATTM